MIRIGYLVKRILAEGGTAGVLGKTSQGVYLSTPSRWVVFCSWNHFCSPLTIVLDGQGDDLERVVVGMRVHLDADKLSIPEASIVLNLNASCEWFPKEPFEQSPALADCSERLNLLKRKVLSIHESGGEMGESANLWIRIGDQIEDTLSQRLGMGEGLTPSGDDFVTGFLLTVNRYKDSFWSQGDLEELNRNLVSAAYQKTTRLSANLIEMATWGESDERLLNAVDYIQGADYVVEDVAGDLSGWGHSSGVAGLAGIAAAVSKGRIT